MEKAQRYRRDTHSKKLSAEYEELIDSRLREKWGRRLRCRDPVYSRSGSVLVSKSSAARDDIGNGLHDAQGRTCRPRRVGINGQHYADERLQGAGRVLYGGVLVVLVVDVRRRREGTRGS